MEKGNLEKDPMRHPGHRLRSWKIPSPDGIAGYWSKTSPKMWHLDGCMGHAIRVRRSLTWSCKERQFLF